MKVGIFWVLVRLAVVALNVGLVIFPPGGKINADWRVGLIGGVAASIGFSVWLQTVRGRPGVDLTAPYSLRKPFWPINTYPIRSWLLATFSISFAGLIGLVGEFAGHDVSGPMPGILLGMGLPLLATLVIWSKVA
jgi:hypothetical protein